MRDLYSQICDLQDMITEDDIDDYERRMLDVKYNKRKTESARRKRTKRFKETYYDDSVSSVKELYEANDNYQNYILIRDFSRDEYDTIICDWDLSEDEVQAIKDAFDRGEYNEKDRVSDAVDWMTFEEAQAMFNDIRVLV